MNDVDIELVVESMSQEKQRSNFGHGANYQDIARDWFLRMPIRILEKRRYAGKQLGHQVSLNEFK